jgi:hypothetical protein
MLLRRAADKATFTCFGRIAWAESLFARVGRPSKQSIAFLSIWLGNHLLFKNFVNSPLGELLFFL